MPLSNIWLRDLKFYRMGDDIGQEIVLIRNIFVAFGFVINYCYGVQSLHTGVFFFPVHNQKEAIKCIINSLGQILFLFVSYMFSFTEICAVIKGLDLDWNNLFFI